MTQSVIQLLEEAEQLSPSERAELADGLVNSLAHDAMPEVVQKQITEVKKRIGDRESGSAVLIGGEEGLARVRRLVDVGQETS